jgi:adenylate cyclase
VAEVTVVFADLTGSTGVSESLGNAKATQAIKRLTEWIGKVCIEQNGRVVKGLGDGLLMVFLQGTDAVEAVQEMQRVHTERIKNWPPDLKMRLQVGMARGEVIEQERDFFGDAVNVAARLADLCAPDQILATNTVMEQLPADSPVRFRSLGAMEVRGRSQPCLVYRVEWQNEVMSDFFTMPASLSVLPVAGSLPRPGSIALSWLDVDVVFASEELPVHLGRGGEAEFVIDDPRVSRLHAKITWRAGRFYLKDLSSYGTWVRFGGSGAIAALRRQECMLLGEGEIALGAPFEDFTVPTISFKFLTGVPLRSE